ncbi:uncharacterized protein EV422DRAFT_272614 [Fimicolochytrium jonesii]|uniref:uncharacterized protein n=1 Tax=Fimicolochytrium jonesii TaxID=1396493 RepID=UPI0022FF2262|nr:uncharacterized protein EV422DRAFT_272614 [Fimicolochytrium jonesii]KAI8816860.1 hypothetical protein EV422DRAFT_272614 [Fimicolochytrium jonesii]
MYIQHCQWVLSLLFPPSFSQGLCFMGPHTHMYSTATEQGRRFNFSQVELSSNPQLCESDGSHERAKRNDARVGRPRSGVERHFCPQCLRQLGKKVYKDPFLH